VWLLALKAMFAERGRLLTSLLGVAFSVALVNLQAGLLLGLIQKASLLVDFGRADIWVGHRHVHTVDMTRFIPERWVYRIRGVEGVARAEPYVVMFGQMSMPDGRFENVVVVGSDRASLLGNAWVMASGGAEAVREPDGILVDVCDFNKIGHCKLGDVREINGHRCRVVGLTNGIVGFTTEPYVFTTLDRARDKYATGIPPDHCSYFLVEAAPGVDVRELAARIRQRLPEADVYDRDAYRRLSMEYWLTRTGIGISFGLATLLGLVVGLSMVSQTLYASVTEHLKEFGTLKAMGAGDRTILAFIMTRALANAFLGSALGLLVAYLAGHALNSPRAPIELTWAVAGASVVLVTLACVAATSLPYWRIRRIDPASILRS
jgi:putative ABC transport system permease protein